MATTSTWTTESLVSACDWLQSLYKNNTGVARGETSSCDAHRVMIEGLSIFSPVSLLAHLAPVRTQTEPKPRLRLSRCVAAGAMEVGTSATDGAVASHIGEETGGGTAHAGVVAAPVVGATNDEAKEDPWALLGDTIPKNSKVVVIADLHGHASMLETAVHRGRQLIGDAHMLLVLLGDYVDNGPQVRAAGCSLLALGAAFNSCMWLCTAGWAIVGAVGEVVGITSSEHNLPAYHRQPRPCILVVTH